jgi:amino acid transporter
MVESHELLRKLGTFFIILGLILGIIGAIGTFAWSGSLAGLFYLGFFMAIIGFFIALLSKV